MRPINPVFKNTLAAVLGLFLLSPLVTAQAVDTGNLFELDANAVDDPATPLVDDWETLYNGVGSSSAFTGIVADPAPLSIFTGGRKDIQDLTSWGWKTGGVPDKDDITNAYAAAYNNAEGDLIVYFGADRFANNGDAFMGFWFFKDRIVANPDGTFSGQHQVGDILVLVNYPQGAGAVPEIQVIEWNPALEDIATNLHLLSSGAKCDGSGGAACAITNDVSETSPWPYLAKNGSMDVFPQESFFEGGINLTQILGTEACFSSFIAETRSSSSVTATLKDFVIGDFDVCKVAVSKTCDVVRLTDANDPTDKFFAVSFSGAVTNAGAGTFPAGEIVTVTDDAGTVGDTSDDVVITFPLAAPLLPGASVPFSGEFFSNDNPPTNTVTASITFAGLPVTSLPYSVECGPLVLNPSLALSKLCSTQLTTQNNLLAVQVNAVGEVCNNGDVPLTVVVDDDRAGNVLPATELAVGACAPLQTSYLPSIAEGGETNPALATFKDTFTAVGTSPLLSDPVVEMRTATCPLCP